MVVIGGLIDVTLLTTGIIMLVGLVGTIYLVIRVAMRSPFKAMGGMKGMTNMKVTEETLKDEKAFNNLMTLRKTEIGGAMLAGMKGGGILGEIAPILFMLGGPQQAAETFGLKPNFNKQENKGMA